VVDRISRLTRRSQSFPIRRVFAREDGELRTSSGWPTVTTDRQRVRSAKTVTPQLHTGWVRSGFIPGGELPGKRSLIVPALTGLIFELADLIRECITHGCCYFVIEAPARHRYVQGLIRPGEDLSLESVSNASLGNCYRLHCLDREQQRRLAQLGWHPPDACSRNWYHHLNTLRDPTPLAAELLVRTLAEIHGIRTRSVLNVVIGLAIGGTSPIPVERRQSAS
jgi:hypothetical protein